MSKISIRRTHQLTHKQAVEVANQVAAELAEEYGITSSWEGNTAHVKGNGVTGSLHLAPKAIEIDVILGFMLSIFQQKIQEGIEGKLEKLIGVEARKPK